MSVRDVSPGKARPGRAGGRAVVALAVAAGHVAGCSGIKPGRSPEATFEAIRKAMLEKKYEALWNLLSARTRDREIAGVRREQSRWEKDLDNMTQEEKQEFLRRNGVLPDKFVNMSPAEVFAMRMRNTSRLVAGLREAIEAARLISVETDGDAATARISIGEEEEASLALRREHGLYRVKSFDALLNAFRPAERMRRPGRTPGQTVEAFRACVRDRAYGDLWRLLSPAVQEKLADSMDDLKEQVKELPASERRRVERGLGVSVDEFEGMPPEDAFGAYMRFVIELQRQLPPILAGEVVSAKIEGEQATAVLRSRRGDVQIPMVLEDGRWLLEGF